MERSTVQSCLAAPVFPEDMTAWRIDRMATPGMREPPTRLTTQLRYEHKKDRHEGGLSVVLDSSRKNQATAAPSLRRRYATSPTPKKPRIIIAQVDGSGTAETVAENVAS